MGDTDLETMANVTIAEYDYEDEAFDNVSDIAKEFIDSLLVKTKEKRLTAEACLKHSWLSTVIPNDKDLKSTKQNLKSQSNSSNYYLFDSNTRTMSVASNHEEIVPEDEEEEWEWDEDTDVTSNDNITNAETLFAQAQQKPSSSIVNTVNPQITHQQVQNRVTEIIVEQPRKRRSNDDSASNLEGKKPLPFLTHP